MLLLERDSYLANYESSHTHVLTQNRTETCFIMETHAHYPNSQSFLFLIVWDFRRRSKPLKLSNLNTFSLFSSLWCSVGLPRLPWREKVTNVCKTIAKTTNIILLFHLKCRNSLNLLDVWHATLTDIIPDASVALSYITSALISLIYRNQTWQNPKNWNKSCKKQV